MELLRIHMRIHTTFPSIGCHVCKKLFRRSCQRDHHLKKGHGMPAPKKERKQSAPPGKRKIFSFSQNYIIYGEVQYFVKTMIRFQLFDIIPVSCVA